MQAKTEVKSKSWRIAARLMGLVFAQISLVYVMISPEMAFGFGLGALAFCVSFVSVEQVARRVFMLSSFKQGVLSGLFWVFFKFAGPAWLLFYAIWRGLPLIGVVVGLAGALLSVALVLWVELRESI
jgi:hypothetical protein